MPAITLILNTNHSNKATVLVSTAQLDRAYLLTQSRNKFRSKALSTVFRRGGIELLPDETLSPDEKEVWISKGEEYCGPPARQRLRELGDVAEIRTLADKSFVDVKAVKQLEAVAGLPNVRVAVGMPDLHPGSRFPVGCSIIADGVYPALIGSDIGCGIAVYRLSSLPSRLDPAKLAARLIGLDDPWDGPVSAWLAKYEVKGESEFDKTSLGTIGGGNHFAEICRVESIADEEVARALDVTSNDLYLMGNGSRGLGGQILDSQTSIDSNPYLSPASPALLPYLESHDSAVRWAIANRDLIANRVANCLSLSMPLPPITPVESADGVPRWLHRKGAAPTDRGVVPCPGSRGDFSWLLVPTGDGQVNAQSLAHGAGRLHPRKDMHSFSKPAARGSLLTTALDSHVICEDAELLVEERPEAYKSIECVVADLEDAGVARRGVCLRPVVTYKCRR